MQLEEPFRALVAATSSTIPEDEREDLIALYRRFGLRGEGRYGNYDLAEHIEGLVLECVGTSNRVALTEPELRRLRRQLILRRLLDEADAAAALALVEVLMSCGEPGKPLRLRPFADNAAWRKALAYAHDINTIRPYRDGELATLEVSFPRERAIAAEASALRKRGYAIEVKDGALVMSQRQQRRLVSDIETLIRRLGAKRVVFEIFGVFSKSYDTATGRHRQARTISTGPMRDRRPSFPKAWVLNLALKQIHEANEGTADQAAWTNLIDLATAYAAHLDVEPYTMFEYEFATPQNVLSYLREIALYDAMFIVPQGRAATVATTVRGLFGWLREEGHAHDLPWRIEDVATFATALIEAGEWRGARRFNPRGLPSLIAGIPRERVEALLSVLSHRKQLNEKLSLPEEYDAETFGKRPLVPLPDGSLVLLDPTWCAPAFYDAMVDAFRQRVPGFHRKMGRIFEVFVREEITRRGVNCTFGDYYEGTRVAGDCDIVVETATHIILIECKKKPLTRDAKSGDSVALLEDLAMSLIHSQFQLGRQEHTLRTRGFIELVRTDGRTRVELRGRAIERVSLTLLDYGGLQDRTLLFELMRVLPASEFISKDEDEAKRLADVGERCAELREQFDALLPLRSGRDRDTPGWNCWFLNLEHLFALLDHTTDNESFARELLRLKHLTTKCMDFHIEYAYARSLSASTPDAPSAGA